LPKHEIPVTEGGFKGADLVPEEKATPVVRAAQAEVKEEGEKPKAQKSNGAAEAVPASSSEDGSKKAKKKKSAKKQ